MPQDLSWLPDQPKAAQSDAPFRQWYTGMAKQHGLSADPDDPQQRYDYRAAFKAGAKPDASGHWPSTFKQPGHPNEIVGGFNTRTGDRVAGVPQASEDELVKLGWEPETAKRLSAAKADLSWLPDQPKPRKPAAAEDFMTPEDITNRDMTAADLGIGVLKAVGRSAVGLSKLAAMPGALVGGQGAEHPIFKRADAALASSNPAQDVGGYMETAAEIAVPVVRGAKMAASMVPAMARNVGPVARTAGGVALDVATGHPLRAAGKVLGSILDAAKPKPVAVPAAVRSPVPFTGTGMTPTTVPQGGFSMPAPRPAPTVAPPAGRVVPRTEPSINTALADQLEAIRTARAMPPVELPPPTTLPAGYTPRATVPKPKPVKMAAPEPAPAAPPKRAYFLKPESELAAVADDVPVAPSGTLDAESLPAAWQQHIGQDLFPLTGKEGEAVAAELLQELTSRGLSVGEAMMAVSKNPEVPVQLRQQLLKSLSRVKVKR